MVKFQIVDGNIRQKDVLQSKVVFSILLTI